MNLHLFSVITIYLFSILIAHILIKNYLEDTTIIKKKQVKAEDEQPSTELVIEDDNLVDINDFDELSARNELLKYLENDDIKLLNESNNFLTKNIEERVSSSDNNNEFSKNEFEKKNKIKTDKHFTNNKDSYTFDAVPTTEEELKENFGDNKLSPVKNDKLFGNVEAFDDFDSGYASFNF